MPSSRALVHRSKSIRKLTQHMHLHDGFAETLADERLGLRRKTNTTNVWKIHTLRHHTEYRVSILSVYSIRTPAPVFFAIRGRIISLRCAPCVQVVVGYKIFHALAEDLIREG